MNSNELEDAWRQNVVRRRRSDDAASLNTTFLSPTMNVANVTPRNRANLRRLKTNSLQSFKRWEKENELLYAMIEDLSDWLKKLFNDVVMTPEFFFFALEDGSLLCRLGNYIQEKADAYAVDQDITVPGKTIRYNIPLKRGSKEQKRFRSRENVQLFLTWCRSHSIPEAILFESNDVVQVDECREGGREIVICLMDLARRFEKYNLDEVPQLIQMEQEIEQEEREAQDSNDQGQTLDTHSEQQPPEATSPTSVDSDSGVDSVFDEDNPANRISEFSSDTTDGVKMDKKTAKQKPDLPSLLESTVPKTQLDKQVCKIAQDYNIKLIQRLKEGKYIILGRTMFVRMLNDHLLLRIGGGWDTLEHYLMTHVPKPGAEISTALLTGASPRISWNAVKARARLFEQGKINGQTPKAEHRQEPPAVVISKASPVESPESPSNNLRRRLSGTQKDERDISEAIRKISSTVLTQKTPSITNKTFFLLKKRFDKGFLSKVRRRDSEPNLEEAKLVSERNMADFIANTGSVDGLSQPPREINSNEIDVKENGNVRNTEFFVQPKVTDVSFPGDEIHTQTRNAENQNELSESPSVAPLIDVVTPGVDDGALEDSSLDDTSQQKESEGQEMISFDAAPAAEEKAAVGSPSAEEGNLITLEEDNQVEAAPAGNEFVGEDNTVEDLKSENEQERNVAEETKPEAGVDSDPVVSKPAEEVEKEPAKDEDAKPDVPEAKAELVAEVNNDASAAKSVVKEAEQADVTKKETKMKRKKEEVKKSAPKTTTVEAAKAKPKAAILGRPKAPTKLPSKTEAKKEVSKPDAAAKKETGAKSAAPKAPGGVRKTEPKKAPERRVAARPTSAKKEPSALQKKPAGAATKPSASVAPQKPAAARMTKAPSATGPKKPATAKPGATDAAKPAGSKARPQSAKPASKALDKTDGQAAGKPARPQSAAAKPKAPSALKKPTTSSVVAKPKSAATGVPAKPPANRTVRESKVASTTKAAKPDSGAKKAADGKPTPRPGTAKTSSTTKSSAPEKPTAASTKAKVGAARLKSATYKAPVQKGKDGKPAGPTASKKPALKKDSGKAAEKKTAARTEKPNTEADPTSSEAGPNLESPPTESVLRETKSETVEVEGDVIVRTVETTRELVGPNGEKQITTTTEKIVEQKTGEVALENSDQDPSESAPTTEEAAEGTADEKSPKNADEMSEDQRAPSEPVPSEDSPPVAEVNAGENSPDNPDDTSQDQGAAEPVPSEESPSVTEESPPVAETSKTVEIDDGTMTTTVVTTEDVIGPDGEKETTTVTETVVEEVADPEKPQDVEAETKF